MRIVYTESFTKRFENQLIYISQDNPSAAKRLKRELIIRIKQIPQNPYLHRQSIYFEDESIRELIFKGYTIVFRINSKEKQIEVFGFVKFQEEP